MMIFALYCPFLFLNSSQGLYRAVAASIDGSNYLVIDTTIYGTDLSCLFGIPQLQPFFFFFQHFQRFADEILTLCLSGQAKIITKKKKKKSKFAGGDNPRRHGNERERVR